MQSKSSLGLIAAAAVFVLAAAIIVYSLMSANTARCAQLSAQYIATLSGQVYNQVDIAKARVAYAHACDSGSAADADQQLAHWRSVYPNQG
jgi:hypothetical protein